MIRPYALIMVQIIVQITTASFLVIVAPIMFIVAPLYLLQIQIQATYLPS